MSNITILVADDHSLVRYGLCSILNSTPGMEVIGEASEGHQAVDLFNQHWPHVTFLDIGMPGLDGIETCRQIRKINPEALVIIMTMHLNEKYLNQALSVGASGYMLKTANKDDLINSIHRVLKGEKVFSAAVTELLNLSFIKGRSGAADGKELLSRLTKRERQILQMISEGLTNFEISEQLFISQRTVESHRANILKKLNVKNTAALVRMAMEFNLI
jgi:DNA-binding NarL/FixJ family response regulator